MKEKRLGELSKRIFTIIKKEPFTAESYSKVYTDIVLTFVDLKLDSMLSHFKIDPNIEQNKKMISYIDNLNKSLNFEDNRVFELFFLIPQLEYELDWCDLERIYDITDILQNLKFKYGIIVEESQLEEHWKARHNIELPENILTKLFSLCSHYLKINKLTNIEDVHSLLSREDLPFDYLIDAHFKDKVLISNIENMTWERLIFIHELKAISELIPTPINIKMQKFIHSIYKFENKDAEIKNLMQYNEDNDIWKLSRINNFEFIDKSTKAAFMISKYILSLLETIKKQPNLLYDYIIKPVVSNIEFLSGEKYIDSDFELIKLQTKIRQCYDWWIHNHQVADWDNYWINKEKEYLQETLNNTIKDAQINKEDINKQIKKTILDNFKPEMLKEQPSTKPPKPRWSPNFTPELIRKCIEIRESNRFTSKKILEKLSEFYIEEKKCKKCSYETIRQWFLINRNWYLKFKDHSEFQIVMIIKEEDIKPWFQNLKEDEVKYERVFNKL